MASAASEHVIALDGIAVIVNPANGVSTLTRDQIARVFSGEIASWADLGGSSGPINVLARDDRSGTFDSFRSLVLGKRTLVPAATRFEQSDRLSDAVAADASAIGFIGLPYVRSAKPVMVKEAGSLPALPSPMTVATEDYPLSRRLYLYAPLGAREEARAFVDFAVSEEAQSIVERAGFVDLRPECDAKAQDCPTCPRDYRDAVAGACRLSVDFRFDFAARSLDSRGLRDLSRIAAMLARPENAGRAAVLLGFSDDVGARGENVALSRERAELVAAQLRARGLRVAAARGLGPEMPIADNTTPEGRERNRRVEVWLK
jgi:phosphate transport system substrate-binding protein